MKNKKPVIRFKGFSEDWEAKRLVEVVDLENGFAFKGEYFKDEPTNVILLTPGNVNIGGGFQVGKGRFYDVSGNFPQKFILKPDDIFVTMTDLTPTAQTLGLPAIIPDDGNIYLHNQRLGKITGFEGDEYFLFQLLSSEQNHRQIVQSASGTTVKHSSPQRILNCLNYFPVKEEQTQIGNFFKNLDTLITLHQRKYDKLGTVKKAMLEKMFPKNGADVPEIRFKGFGGAWEVRTLEDLFGIASASRVHKHEWTESGVPFFRSSDVVSDYKGQENNKAFISFELYEELSKKSGCVQKNDILVTGGGSIGIPYLVKSNEPLYFKDADLLWLKNSDNVNGYFLYTFFSTSVFRGYINSITHIGTISHYTIEQAKVTPIKIPEREEQDKIGAYFTNLDNLLTLHKGELEKLKNIKKAMLERMFV